MHKPRIHRPAIKTKSGAVILSAEGKNHDSIGHEGQRGFMTTDPHVGELGFVNRVQAGKIAKASGQAGHMPTRHLHSSNLKKT